MNHEDESEALSVEAAELNRSLRYIDEIIAQIKYSHLEVVWEAQIKNLFKVLDLDLKKKHLRAL